MMRVWSDRVWNEKRENSSLFKFALFCKINISRRKKKKKSSNVDKMILWWKEKNKVLSYDETKETTEQQNKKLEYVEMKVEQ